MHGHTLPALGSDTFCVVVFVPKYKSFYIHTYTFYTTIGCVTVSDKYYINLFILFKLFIKKNFILYLSTK